MILFIRSKAFFKSIVVPRSRHLLLALTSTMMLTQAQAASAYPAGGGDEFKVSKIPVELLDGADAVVRLDKRTFVVENPAKAIERVRRAVTIFNVQGRSYGEITVFYDRFRKLKSLRGWLYRADGKRIRKLKKKQDVKDYSAISGYSLYEDHRAKSARLYHNVYPYTVVFEYEVAHAGLISWPAWYPQWFLEPVEKSSYEISVPADMPVRYYTRGMEIKPQVRKKGHRRVLRWETGMLPKRELEPYGPAWSVQAPSVLLAPAAFEIAGFAGDMSTWAAFGNWYQELAALRSTLPEPALAEVRGICETAATSLEKVRRIYAHLQAKTRYVSVQLGIGGWQPF
ncbi:MAG: DUF3857 domain-containing protein, partial [bacterium]